MLHVAVQLLRSAELGLVEGAVGRQQMPILVSCACTAAQDAQAVCRHLGLPLVEVDFVAQYWQRVFQPFLDQCVRDI